MDDGTDGWKASFRPDVMQSIFCQFCAIAQVALIQKHFTQIELYTRNESLTK
jgi:hypothetical protein